MLPYVSSAKCCNCHSYNKIPLYVYNNISLLKTNIVLGWNPALGINGFLLQIALTSEHDLMMLIDIPFPVISTTQSLIPPYTNLSYWLLWYRSPQITSHSAFSSFCIFTSHTTCYFHVKPNLNKNIHTWCQEHLHSLSYLFSFLCLLFGLVSSFYKTKIIIITIIIIIIIIIILILCLYVINTNMNFLCTISCKNVVSHDSSICKPCLFHIGWE